MIETPNSVVLLVIITDSKLKFADDISDLYEKAKKINE